LTKKTVFRQSVNSSSNETQLFFVLSFKQTKMVTVYGERNDHHFLMICIQY